MRRAVLSGGAEAPVEGAAKHDDVGAQSDQAQDVRSRPHRPVGEDREIRAGRFADQGKLVDRHRCRLELPPAVVRHPKGIRPRRDQARHGGGIEDALDHEGAVPFAR